tara:strand:- start:7071 stop:7247 length:177 start_codon:yes stop_codon:yes gene_type:complete
MNKELTKLLMAKNGPTLKEKIKLAENALRRLAQGKHVKVNTNILKLVTDSIFEDHANQ